MAPTTKKDGKSSSSPNPPGQKSLTSFFGAAKSKKTGEPVPPKKIQSGIIGGLKKQATAAAGSSSGKKGNDDSNSKVKEVDRDEETSPPKENVENGDEKMAEKSGAPTASTKKPAGEDLMDTDDEDDKIAKKPAAAKKEGGKKSVAAAKTASRKRVIDSDDSEEENDGNDDEDEQMMGMDEDYDEEQPEEEEEEEDMDDMDDEDDDLSDEDEEEPAPKKSNAAKKQKTLTGKPAPKKSTKKKGAGSKSAAQAEGMKSNAKLLEIMAKETISDDDKGAKTWEEGKPTPYSALCDTFNDLDGESGKLIKQEIVTEFLRKVLLRDGGGSEDDEVTEKEEMDEMKLEDGWEDEDDDGKKPAGGKEGKAKKGKAEGKATNKKDDSRSDLYTLVYLATNSVAPQHANVELGVGDSILIKAIAEASGSTPKHVKDKYEKEGDLGTVAQTSKGKQRTLGGLGFGKVSGPKRLTCADVLKVFKEIANTTGSQSQKWKVDKIKSLLVRAKGSESKYIIRGLQGKLRIGVNKTTVLTSLAHAVVLTRPRGVKELSEEKLAEIRALDGTEEAYPDCARKLCSSKLLPRMVRLEAAEGVVKKAYHQYPSFDKLLDALLSAPLMETHKLCPLTPGIPVIPMLAKPTKSILEVLKRLNGLKFTCEYKYDGERAQVHLKPNGETQVFSRNLLNTSEKFPEVPLYVQESCKETSVTSFVLDTEVVAWNRETSQFVPFQTLSTRKRKEESAESAKVQVIVQAFDLMYLNGESLLDKTLAERRELLKKNFLPIEGKFQYATSLDHTENGDTAQIEEFLDAAIKGQCEGLMVKTLEVNAVYEPDRRSLNWLKLKKDYLEGLGDSFDLVPVGAFHGRGKRTGVYGAYLLACYDEDTEEFQSVCKVGTGFSDEDLQELSSSLKPHIIKEKSSQYNISDSMDCDVWFDAVQVWEIKAADLSKSSTHKGAIDKTGESGRGIGLRFPRFERVRPDKKPEQATSSDQILEMYYNQDSIVDGDGGMDEDGI